VISLRSGAAAGPNPWDAYTLEWSVPSPTPPYNFAIVPQVATRHPLWEERLGESVHRSILDEGLVLDHEKEALAVTSLDAQPEVIMKMADDSLAPVLLTVAMTLVFTGLLLHLWWLVIVGGAGVLATLGAWLWPNPSLAIRAGATR
jgi:cytochrome c oxidase subunit 1/cytochrome c oxidase subunit I+III